MKTRAAVRCAGLAMALWANLAVAQTAPVGANFPTQFPEGVQTPNAADLVALFGGKVFKAKFANGLGLRYEFGKQYVFVDLSTGARDNGTWHTEDGKVCFVFRGPFTSGCGETRTKDGVIHVKRATTGEVFTMVAE